MTLALRVVSVVGIAIGTWLFVFAAARSTGASPRTLGLRGLKRQQALEEHDLFASTEPVLRWLAPAVALLPLGGVRASLDATLKHAGDWLGLDANEFLALSGISGVLGLSGGSVIAAIGDLPGASVLFFGGLGLVLPYLALTGEAQARAKAVGRALPGAIDLAALCMTAGLSFPQALEQIVSKSGDWRDPLNEEIGLLLSQLRLGWTRRRALEGLAERVPSTAVRSFVSAVVQSEERGTPLVDVLTIQATTLRERRSQMGEEAAARAAVMMMAPLMLILAAIIVLLMGPFVLQGMESGF